MSVAARDVATDVRAYVAANPGRTLDEIAGTLHIRSGDVRQLLRAGGYQFAPRDPHASRSPFVYQVASEPQAGQGRAAAASQNGRLLRILADGEWHRSDRLHAAVFCVLHSRVAELRRRGYLIEHRGGGGGADQHWYRLVAARAAA